MKIKDINMEELKKVVELLAKNHRCPQCPYNNTSMCGNRVKHRCIKSKEYWINHLSNVDENEYNATIELVLSGKYQY